MMDSPRRPSPDCATHKARFAWHDTTRRRCKVFAYRKGLLNPPSGDTWQSVNRCSGQALLVAFRRCGWASGPVLSPRFEQFFVYSPFFRLHPAVLKSAGDRNILHPGRLWRSGALGWIVRGEEVRGGCQKRTLTAWFGRATHSRGKRRY